MALFLFPMASAQGMFFGSSANYCYPYCSNATIGIVAWGTVPNVGGVLKNGSVVYDTSLASHGLLSRVSRCTDQAIVPAAQASSLGNHSKSAGLGGSGDAVQLFNASDPPTLLGFNDSGGSYFITGFTASTMTCTGALTGANNLTNPGSANTAYNFGGGSFDWTNSAIYYAFGNGVDAPANGAAKYTFNSSNNFTVTTPYMDFGCCGLPVGSQAPAWQASHAYSNGDYVSFTLTEPDWTASNAYSTLGTIIKPLTNNPLGCAFKLTVTGTSGTSGSEPTWSTTGSCNPASEGQITDNTAKWRNLGAGPVFVGQLTSASGTSGGTTPSFDADFLSTTTDSSLTWTNVGVNVPPAWQSFAGVSQDGTRFCSAFSTNSYGNSGNYTLYNGDQGTGVFAGCYSFTLNEWFLLNTATGIQSETTCSGGTGGNCSGGTLSKITAQGTTFVGTGNCAYVIHNMKGSVGQDYVAVARQTLLGGGGSCGGAEPIWTPFVAFNATTSFQVGTFNLNHWAMQNSHVLNMGQNTGINGGFAGGAYTQQIPLSNPAATPAVTWQVGVPYTTACDPSGTWTPGDVNPPCDYPAVYDSHLGSAYNPGGTDTWPVCGSLYNVITNAPPPVAPAQEEEVCVSTNPTWSYGSTIGPYQVYRFTHSFNTGSNAFFDVQFAISEASKRYLAFGSDWNCTLGNTAGGTSPLYCGPPWVPSTVYTNGQLINPFSGTGGAGTNYGVYEVTTGGTSASSTPAWFVCNSGTTGNTVTDANGVVYTCENSSNGKGEVFIVETHP